jgi:hypothetical protein
MSRTPLILAAAALGVLLACAADRPTCYAGDHLGCTCAGPVHGYQVCNAGGDGYGACVCDGTTPGLDASTPPTPAVDAAPEASIAEAGAKKGLFEPCADGGECASGLCQVYPSKGSLCSNHCTAQTASVDCPPPSTGCNPQGVCKAP